MDVFELSASLRLDKSEYENGLDDAEKSADSKGSKIGSILSGAGKVAAVGITAVAAATTAVTTALVGSTKEVAEYGDNIDKMSQKMGISAEAYQEWDAILQHSGTSIDSMSRGMQTLQKNAVNSADKFEKLGITQEQLANMSTEELFSATIAGLQGMGEGAERTALASELLGGSAKELGALLNTSAEDTETMRKRVHELGGVMSNDAVKAAAAYQDALQDMQTGFDGLKRNLVSEFLPSVTSVMDGLTDIFGGDSKSGLAKISEGINSLVTGITEELPKFIEVGAKIIESIGDAIISNLPTLMESGVSLVMNLATSLVENLPRFLEVALMLIMTLADGIIKALPELIPAVVETITKLAEMLTEPNTLVKLIMAAVQIILAINEGLIKAIPQLLEAVPVIIGNLIKAIIMLAPQLLDAGIQLIKSMVDGIMTYYETLFKIAGELIQNMINGIKNKQGELFNTVTTMLETIKKNITTAVEYVSQFIRNMLNVIHNFIKNVFEQIKATINSILNAVKTIITNMFNAYKTIVESVINIIKTVIETQFNVIKTIIETVLNLVKAIFTGSWNELGAIVQNGVSNILNIISNMVTSIANVFTDLKDKAFSWGSDMIQNFVDGITGKMTALLDKVRSMAENIKSYLHFSEPDKGPLSDFHTYAPDMIDLFIKGIEDNQGRLMDAVGDAFNFENLITGPAVTGDAVGRNVSNVYNINIYQPVKSPSDVARAIREEAQYGLLGGGNFA